MAESFKGIKRTHYCGEVTQENIGQTVTVCGWINNNRDLGGIVFLTVRDRSGLIQCVTDKSSSADIVAKAASVRSEYVVAITGEVRRRTEGNEDGTLSNGLVELEIKEMRILAEAQTPPFEINKDVAVKDEVRLKYRYLDLRRPALQRNMMLRSKAAKITRDFFAEEGFLEIETPVLTKSTPEGARDYLVPSRVQHGKFYALPQSPQIYKQILMLSGMDKYIQIARCFRDEDLRADRQPEFTQIDLEMSFIDVEDILAVNERFLKCMWKEALGVDIETPFKRLTYKEAMERYGSDKPDTRFGFELTDLTDIVGGSGYKIFTDVVASGGSVRGINVKQGAGTIMRRDVDALNDFVKIYRAKGLSWIRLADETTSSFLKFMSEDETAAIMERMGAEQGDCVFIIADKDKVVFDTLGALRLRCADMMGLIDKNVYDFLWVTEFPLLEKNDDGSYGAVHHPFTAPMDEDIALLDSDPGSVRAKAYDVILNGNELGGGSIRIFQPDLQKKMFSLLGLTDELVELRFGFLIEAFRYGAPPHGGLAYGLDRLVMLLAGEDSIRDTIAFPKVQTASELMSNCPDEVSDKQLEELAIKVVSPK